MKLLSKRSMTYSSILYSFLAVSPLFSAPLADDTKQQIPATMVANQSDDESTKRVDQQNVVSIQIDNMTAHEDSTFNERVVLQRLDTKVGQNFSQITFDQDLKTLSDEFDRVEPAITFTPDGIRISILIWEKPLIHSIEWTGNTHIGTKKLRKELGIKTYSLFDRQSFNKAINKVREFYLKKGYFQSEIQYEILRHTENNTVTIEVTVHEGPPSYIDKIEVTGVTPAEEKKVRELLQTSKYNILFSWFSGSGVMREEVVEQDRLVIVNYLQNEGYADAYVNYTVEPSKDPNRINLKVDVEKGSIYKFRKVTFRGNASIPDEQIEIIFQVHPDENYSPEKIRATVTQIKDLYGSKGKIETAVDYDIRLVPDSREYDVDFFINEGDEFYVGMIRVYGNTQTNTNVVLRESLLIPGDKFDSQKLKATQQRLENIGYFKNVNVYAVKAPDDDSLGENYRDVHIEVEEKPTGNVNLFFGFSTADSVYGGLELVETNFNHHGFSRFFREGLSALRGGGEYFHSKVTVGERQQSYLISWLDPYFRDSLWRLGIDGNYSTGNLQSKDYRIHTTTGSIYTSYPINFLWSYGFKYRLRYTTTEVSHSLDHEQREQVDQGGFISAGSTFLSYDSTDSLMKPRKGLRSNLEFEVAGIGGDFDFGKLTYVNTYYASLWRHGIMKYRYDLKYLLPFGQSSAPDDIPLSERFFLGGEYSVRGYKAFTLGPKFNTRDPKGGITSALISAEYLQEIIPLVDAFIFADAGSISLKKLGIDELRMSVGGGLRLELINRVPVVIGYGVPLNVRRADRGDVQHFYISMGGQF